MKRVYLYIILSLGFFSSCVDLDRFPEDALTDNVFFQNHSDFKLYVNGLYPSITRGMSRWGIESGNDNYLTEGVPGMVMQHSNSGKAPMTSKLWNDTYDHIRKVNYVLGNVDKLQSGNADQYIGEAHYIRAWHYYTLLVNFGGVPYIDKVLSMDSEELYTERSSRDFIASKIIEDLDNAIKLLNWKNTGAAETCRINKEAALLMKTRVALYEGSWEYYHGKKGSPFAVAGKDGIDFLNSVIAAGDELINHVGSSIYKGGDKSEYSDLFTREDYSNIPSAFYYKHYDSALGVSSGLARQTLEGLHGGVTHELVTSYLMMDGKPEDISSIKYDKTNQSDLIAKRDPRLYQTVYSPARGDFKTETYKDLPPFENAINTLYSPITLPFQGVGGYRVFKGTVLKTVGLDVCNCDDLILRYEEALLNYAEAKAILGSLKQEDIDKTVNLIRGRVNMVPMKMEEVNSWSSTYSEKNGFDPSASNILNEIRRERRIELALEGFRTDDLKRWAVWEHVINGYKPRGAYYKELEDYFNNTEVLQKAGLSNGQISQVKFRKGANVDALGDYINPYWKNPDLSVSGRGYYINPERDYLQAIPQKEIDHYLETKNVVLTQNPGWF